MRFRSWFAAAGMAAFWATATLAETWVQIEARPNLAAATARAEAYAAELPDVNGFRLSSGWFAIALGPYADEDEARVRLGQLRAARLIPSDSFLSDGGGFGGRFFGRDSVAVPVEPAKPLRPGDETVEEARLSERDLTREERQLIQIAMEWVGTYVGRIDASFGPGTRRAMADWQIANGFEATGVLTTGQRRQLLESYQGVLRALDIRPVADARAGIEIDLPNGLVAFDRIDPPFAQYNSTTDDGVRVLLLSQTGGRDALAALFDIMQTLEIVPVDGPRELKQTTFTLVGRNDRIVSHTYAQLAGSAVKGFTLIWPAGDEKRRQLALDAMLASFRATDTVLPDVVDGAAQDIDLLAGLEIRRPERSRSGFYIAADGTTLTTAEAVGDCTRVTLGDDTEMEIAARDTELGLALLRPRTTLAPLATARLAALEPRLQSEIAVAGYSFGGALTAPSVTFGQLADVKSLEGDTRVQRLAVDSRPEDAGGPVFDGSGAVMGLLQTPQSGARVLPDQVAYATDAPVLVEFLSAQGIEPSRASAGEPLAPEDLTLLASEMTVLVNCWN